MTRGANCFSSLRVVLFVAGLITSAPVITSSDCSNYQESLSSHKVFRQRGMVLTTDFLARFDRNGQKIGETGWDL